MKVKTKISWMMNDLANRYDNIHEGDRFVEVEASLPREGRFLIVKVPPDLEAHIGHFELISASSREKAELKKRGLIKG